MVIISSLCILALYPPALALRAQLPSRSGPDSSHGKAGASTNTTVLEYGTSFLSGNDKALALKLQTRDKINISGAHSNEPLESLDSTDRLYSQKLANSGEECSKNSCGPTWYVYRTPVAAKALLLSSLAFLHPPSPSPFPLSSCSLTITATITATELLSWVVPETVAAR